MGWKIITCNPRILERLDDKVGLAAGYRSHPSKHNPSMKKSRWMRKKNNATDKLSHQATRYLFPSSCCCCCCCVVLGIAVPHFWPDFPPSWFDVTTPHRWNYKTWPKNSISRSTSHNDIFPPWRPPIPVPWRRTSGYLHGLPSLKLT